MYDTSKPYKEKTLELIRKTWKTPYISVKEGIYPIFKKKFSYSEVDHTDGIGTKGVYHWQKKTLKNACLDALAMNLNDLVLVGARPYKLQSHLLIPEDDRKVILTLLKVLSEECLKRKIAITGGETSIHNNLNGLEIGITMSGFIKKQRINKFKKGDVLIGIKSNGLHSNGFTKIKEIFGKEFRPEFVRPTYIYSETILSLDEQFNLHGMMHITGGAYMKLKDLLGKEDIRIEREHKLLPQKIFREIYEKGVSDEEMYKTFNCGIGFILSISPREAKRVILKLNNDGFKADIIGEVTLGTGKIKIESAFSKKELEF